MMIHGMGRNKTGRRHIPFAKVMRMDIYSYKIIRDYGFAPNPFFGVCTLATCKPDIRCRAQIGDWILAIGGTQTVVSNRLVCLMRVDEAMTFDEYWNDERFQCKKPSFDRALKYCYGDNIYHHAKNGTWLQANSHHSKEGGAVNEDNLKRDTRVNRVLVSKAYWYFGADALELPSEYIDILPNGRNYKRFCMEEISLKWVNFQKWIKSKFAMGQHGLPCKWKDEKGFTRYKGEKSLSK